MLLLIFLQLLFGKKLKERNDPSLLFNLHFHMVLDKFYSSVIIIVSSFCDIIRALQASQDYLLSLYGQYREDRKD